MVLVSNYSTKVRICSLWKQKLFSKHLNNFRFSETKLLSNQNRKFSRDFELRYVSKQPLVKLVGLVNSES